MENTRNVWIDYLRSFLTVLVVAHHATLAYTTFAYFDQTAYINSTNPIVDIKRWVGLDIFENFNDVFFMSLMFLIGGLFLSKSLAKKGPLNFIADRIYRLLFPFILLGPVLMLIAYFPSFYVAHQSTNVAAYIKDFFTTEHWPMGPFWFVWVLFLFNILLLAINLLIQKTNSGTARFLSKLQHQPFRLFCLFLVFTWVLYVPVAYHVGAGTWTGFGPFDFQLSRLLLYFGYFMIGVMIGTTDFNNGLFAQNSAVVRRYGVWIALALAAYAVLTITPPHLERLVKENRLKPFNGWMIYYTMYVSSCVLSCLAFLSTFRKFAIQPKKWWASLSANAYLIYMVHYVFITWTQFLLMDVDIPAFCKFMIVFVVTLALSWAASGLLRKNRLIRQYL